MDQSGGNPRRKILNIAIAQMLSEKGFTSADKDCLETLTEMLQSLIVEAGRSAKSYCELAGRTEPVLGDVVVALSEMGISLNGIESFAKRDNKSVIPMPPQQSQQKQLSLLQAGAKSSLPSYMNGHYVPDLPDPHAYVRTPTHKQPVTEYEAIREKAATQKRDIERALTKYLSKTTETHSLFDNEDNMFPLIACKPSHPPYVAALNPTDQVFDFEELEYHYLVANRTEDVTAKDENDENESGNDEEGENQEGKGESKEKGNPDLEIKPNSVTNKAILENPNIKSPYLRAATLPKRTNKLDLANIDFGLVANQQTSTPQLQPPQDQQTTPTTN